MDDVETPPRRASFGLSLSVALGWYVTAIAVIYVWRSATPTTPDRDCSAAFSCLTPGEEVALLLIFGAPVLLGLLVSTLLATAVLVRRLSSPILTGTLSALASIALVGVVSALWQGAS